MLYHYIIESSENGLVPTYLPTLLLYSYLDTAIVVETYRFNLPDTSCVAHAISGLSVWLVVKSSSGFPKLSVLLLMIVLVV